MNPRVPLRLPAATAASAPTLLLVLAAFLFSTHPAAAAPGDLDVTLGGTGKLRLLPGGGPDTGYAVARQGDGKLIVAGESIHLGRTVPSLIRYTSAGVPDPTFGTDGEVLVDLLDGGFRAVAIESITNKIVLAGYTMTALSDSEFLLMRLNPDGTVDTSFDGNGIRFTDFGSGDDVALALALQTDGRIVAAGYAGQQVAVARYLNNGASDTSLDGDGRLDTVLLGRANAVLLQGSTNPKIVLAGRRESFPPAAFAMRLNFSGTLDTSFDEDGIQVREEIDHAYAITLLAVQAGEEKLILAGGMPPGFAESPSPAPLPSLPKFALWSIDAATGAPDTTFASGGTFTETASPGRAVRVQFSTGVASRIVVGTGSSTVRRFTLDGVPDGTFGGGTGTANASFTGDAMLVQPDGRIVVAGSRNADVAIGRFTSGGVLDTSFSGDGLRVDDLSALAAAARALAIQPDGKLLVAGDFSLVRLLPDGSFDPTFGDQGKVGVSFVVHAIGLQADGTIVLGGTGTAIDLNNRPYDITRLTRVMPNGEHHVGLGSTASLPGTIRALQVRPDGKIVAAGTITTYVFTGIPVRHFAVFGFLANGMLDEEFGTDGVSSGPAVPTDAADYGARALALFPDGRIAAAGPWLGTGTDYDFGVVRLLPDGAFDTTFSGDGIAVVPIGTGHDYAEAVAVHEGRILVGGTVDTSADDTALVRLLANGELDPTFGFEGVSYASLSSGTDTLKALAVEDDGKFVICGSSTVLGTTVLTLVRFHENGEPDPTFATNGQANLDFTPGNLDDGRALAIDAVGRIVAAGLATDRYGVARVLGQPFLSVTRITRDAAGMVSIEGLATPGTSATLRVSPDLTSGSFVPLQSLVPDASGAWQVPHGTTAPSQFYRATRP